MKLFLTNIKKYYKYALRNAIAELKSEVADSYLSYLWWFIEPIAFCLIYIFVFGYVFGNTQKYFASFVFIGIALWTFFNRMLTTSVKLISNNSDLVSKVYIPKYIMLLSKSFTYLFKMFISFLVTFVIIIIDGVPLSFNMLFFIPIVIIFYIISFGISTILMHFGVFVNDLFNFVNIVLRMMFYLSGIFYSIRDKLPGKLGFLLLRINPAAFIIDETRKSLLENKIVSFEGLIIWFIIGIVLLNIGVRLIHKNENSYAKVI